jgi:polysaccharide export outer membrane protein
VAARFGQAVLLAAMFLWGRFCLGEEQKPAGITIEAGDKIEITVYKAADLTVTLEVPEAGEIVYPVLGRIKVAGSDADSLARKIASELNRIGYLQNPEVTVSVVEMAKRKVFILGAVRNSSQVSFSRAHPMYVTQAIAVVGGFTETADRKDVRIVRRASGGPANVLHVDVDAILEGGKAELDVELKDGDTVFVSEVEAVYVFGQVASPGAYRLPPGIETTVSRFVSLAGGLTRFARSNKTRVIHRQPAAGAERVEVVDLKAVVEAGQVEKDVEVHPGDIVFVPETIF